MLEERAEQAEGRELGLFTLPIKAKRKKQEARREDASRGERVCGVSLSRLTVLYPGDDRLPVQPSPLFSLPSLSRLCSHRGALMIRVFLR